MARPRPANHCPDRFRDRAEQLQLGDPGIRIPPERELRIEVRVADTEDDHVFAAAIRHGAALLGVPVSDTLKQVNDKNQVTGTVARRGLWLAQTPQVCRRDWLEEAYARRVREVKPLPGAQRLLEVLTDLGVPWAIATSSSDVTATASLTMLEVPPDVPVITRDKVAYAKPNPDLFLAAAEALGRPITDSFVVGDSVWDMLAAQRAQALGIGVLSGGYGREELETAGAYRSYDDPLDLLEHLDELGIRTR